MFLSILAFLVMPSPVSAWVSLPCGLPGLVLPSQRINITIDSYTGPVGIFWGEWDSARLMAEVARILLEERLGYDAIFSGSSTSSFKAIQTLARCKHPGTSTPECENPALPAVHHILLEAWDLYTDDIVRLEALQGVVAPENHGSIGYDGLEGMYVLERQVREVYESSGKTLAYYRTWNISWNNFTENFARYTDLSASELMACNETQLRGISNAMSNHLKYTNDAGGVETVNGQIVVKCEGGLTGHWWFAPSCRMQPTQCIPLLTHGDGWGLPGFTQKAASYNMPLALATAKTTPAYIRLARQHQVLVYWYKPDAAFVDLDPQVVIFPDANPMAKRAGDYRTQNAAVSLLKFTHYYLGSVAARARDFVASMQMPMASIDELLRRLVAGASITDAACKWLKSNAAIWEPWIPDATSCKPGTGLVGPNTKYVMNKEIATDCRMCIPGKASQRVFGGRTHVCVKCPQGRFSAWRAHSCTNCSVGRHTSGDDRFCNFAGPGFHVPLPGGNRSLPCGKGTFTTTSGNSQCTKCNVGEFADKIGNTECTRCPMGRFAMAPGHTECVACSNPDTVTLSVGARSGAECICKADMYRVGANATGSCERCPVQMSCPQGATERSLMNFFAHGQPAASPFGGIAEPYPTVKKGFWSSRSKPFSIYNCWDEKRCPGGPPGHCAPDMDLSKLSCSHCRTDYTWNGDKCARCTDSDKSSWIFPGLYVISGIVVIVIMYELFRDPMVEWNSWYNKVSVLAFLAFNHYQILSLFTKANIQLPGALGTNSKNWRFTENASLLFNIDCAGFGDLKTFLVAQALAPILFLGCAVLIACVYQTVFKVCGVERMKIDLNRLQNVFFSVFFTYFVGIASMSMTLFKCRQNPNGDYTLSRDLNIVCYESDWKDMLVVSVFAVLIYCVANSILFAWVLLKIERHPDSLSDVGFQMRWKFLLVKFTPEVHWWALVFLIRGVLLNLSFVVSAQGIRQMYFLLTVQTIYMNLTVWFMPWRFRIANACSVLFDAGIIYLTTVPLVYAEVDSATDKELTTFGAVVSFIPLAVTAFVIVVTVLAQGTGLVTDRGPSMEMDEVFYVIERFLRSGTAQREMVISCLGDWDKWHLRRARRALENRFLEVRLSERHSRRSMTPPIGSIQRPPQMGSTTSMGSSSSSFSQMGWKGKLPSTGPTGSTLSSASNVGPVVQGTVQDDESEVISIPGAMPDPEPPMEPNPTSPVLRSMAPSSDAPMLRMSASSSSPVLRKAAHQPKCDSETPEISDESLLAD